MTVNAGLIIGALFVPGLWSVVEYLFPLAMIAFLAIGIWAIRLSARLYSRAMSGQVNIGGTVSFAQVLPALGLRWFQSGWQRQRPCHIHLRSWA